MSRSSRPTGTTRIVAADEVDDRRPALGVARGRDRPARLVEEDVAERLLPDARPSTRTSSVAWTNVLSCPGSPLTVTRPALISSSAPRRDAIPARAR